MRTKKQNDFLEILVSFQKNTLTNKPPIDKMWEEVRMMKFKIRPMEGDIFHLNFKNELFIETLWKLGKIEELFQEEFPKLTRKEKEIFYRLFDNMYDRFQNQLNKIRLKNDQPLDSSPMVEVEIFKEFPLKKN